MGTVSRNKAERMFVKRLILLFIVAVFVFLAVPQAANLLLIWRDYQAVNRYVASYRGRDAGKDYFARRIPVSVAQQDHEAACITSYMLKGLAIANVADNAASAAIQYPSNQFFWTQLAESLACEGQRYDPEILSRIADRLISLDPQNADYYVLKASAALQLRTGNDVNEVLSLLRQAAQCSSYGEPYELYRQRVMAIADKAGLGSFEYYFLQQPFPFTFAFRNVRDDLLDIAQMKFNDGRTAEGIAISDALNDLWLKFGIRYVRTLVPRYLPPIGNYYMYHSPAMLELRSAAVSAERAHHDHLLLASAALQYDVPLRPPPERELPRHYVLAVPFLLHCVRMVCAIVVILVIIILLSKPFTSQSQVSVGVWNGGLFVSACLIYFFVSNLNHWITFNTCCGHHLTYLSVIASGMVTISDLADKPLQGIVILLISFSPLILLFVINKVYLSKPQFPSSQSRLVVKIVISIVLIAILFLSMWHILIESVGFSDLGDNSGADSIAVFLIALFPVMLMYVWGQFPARRKIIPLVVCTLSWSFITIPLAQPYLWWLPFVGSLLTTLAIILYIPFEDGFWRQSIRIFKDPQTAARAVSILVPAVVIYLLLIPISIPWTLSVMKKDDFLRRKPSPSTRVIFPPPTDQTYQAVLESFRGEKPFALGVGALAVLEPADLNSVLSSITEKDWKTLSSPLMFAHMPGGMPGMHSKGGSNQQPSAIQVGLSGLLDVCPRSNVSVIIAALPDPNELFILIKRARLGDISAKQPLLQILSGKYDPNIIHFEPAYYSMPDSRILEALVPVSEPNEAAARLIAAIEKNFAPGANNLPPAPDNHRILAAAMLLPSHQAASVLNAYLERCKSISPLAAGEYLSVLRNVLPFCANASIANQFLESKLNVKWRDNDPDNEPEPPNITPHLGIQSIDLLKSALTSKYASFRAWSVWQLRHLGYKFTAEEIKLLKSDSNVVVRANLVMAVPEAMLRDFAADPSPIIQTVILLRTTNN